MKLKERATAAPSAAQREIRKRYLGATFVTCVVLALIAGTIHVLQLGANRMNEMRDLAGIDVENEKEHIRAAGEDLYRNVAHEKRLTHTLTYTMEEAAGLLGVNEWKSLAEMVEVPAGEFLMGTDYLKADAQNKPQHKVYLDAFKIDKHEVTNAEYARFVAETNHRPPLNWSKGKFDAGYEMHPVTMVTWFDARDYCAWEGKRLPTEAEWEKAARGTDGRRWPWGDRMDVKRLNTYYSVGSTTPVGSYPLGASPYGALDMAGNVAEWVDSELVPYKGSTAPEEVFKAKIPVVPKDEKEKQMSVVDFVETDLRYKVMRGGSWKSDPFSTSTYHRNSQWPQLTTDFYGFRCAQDIAPETTKSEKTQDGASNG